MTTMEARGAEGGTVGEKKKRLEPPESAAESAAESHDAATDGSAAGSKETIQR